MTLASTPRDGRFEPVRVGMVGLGLMGRERARVLAASPWANLIGCADPRADAAEVAPPGVAVFGDYADLFALTGLDAVLIATPEKCHRAPVEAALAAGLSNTGEPMNGLA